jgi:hypothetical protein
MKVSRVLVSGLTALSMTIAAGSAEAKASPSAAMKLTLAGAQAVSDPRCIKVNGKRGKWWYDAARILRECKRVRGGRWVVPDDGVAAGGAGGGAAGGAGAAGGGGLGVGAGLGAAAVLGGVAAGVSSASNSNPSSP